MTSDDIRKAVELLKKYTKPKVHCPKCGKAVYAVKMHPEAAADMAAAGYDGTCCQPGFDILGQS